MATINEITNADSYRGDVAAGGGNDGGAYEIDTRPLMQLGMYTNMYNKTVYDQTIADRDTKLNQVAALSQIDLNNLFGKDKDLLTKKLNNLNTFASEYAKNPNLTIADQLKWQTALSGVQDDYNSGKQRALSYQSQLNSLNTNQSGDQKDILLKELNDKFNNTDISTPISTGTGYKPVSVDLPVPKTIDGNSLINMANGIVDSKWSVYNPTANAALATSTTLGLNSLSDGLNGTEKDLQATASGSAQQWAGMATSFNSVLGAKNTDGSYKYFDAKGDFNSDKFKLDNAANTAIMQPFNALTNLTQYSTQKKNEVAQGIYSDHGITYKAPTNLTPDMFNAGIISFTPDGIKPTDLAQAGMYQSYLGDKVSSTYKKTGLGIAQQNANVKSGELGFKYAKLNFDKVKEQNKTSAGGEKGGIQNPAIMFGTHVDRLKSIFDKNTDPRTTVTIPLDKVDLNTRAALNMDSKDASITYRRDGSYVINSKKGATRVGTLDELKQGYIDVVKGGKDPTQNTSFQSGAEGAFNKTFGSNQGQDIWNNWNGGTQQPTQAPGLSKPSTKEIQESDISGRAASAGYTESEYRQLLIKNGVKIVSK